MHILSRPAGGRVGTWIPFSPFGFFVALRGYLSIDSMGMGMAFALPHRALGIVHRIASLRFACSLALRYAYHITPYTGTGRTRKKEGTSSTSAVCS